MNREDDSSRRAFGRALLMPLRYLGWRWALVLPVFVIWGFAYLRLFIDPTPRLPLLFNWTGSLPYKVALIDYGDYRDYRPLELKRGDFVIFAFAGDAREQYPGLSGQPFFKIVRGLPGDRVSVAGRTVSVNGEQVGIAKTHTRDRQRLDPIEPGVIPAGQYYMQGTSPDSFDSRYQSSGLVRAEQVIGTVVPIF